ncbi:protein zerknuellt 2-like [Rhagoletis pomonella]|uniref:protein zerknuellt 2-like n=1 Tax=Rhagoletis pomonella TaxID=28610 RepID=UPI0017875A92|nr:protein zerknuellt 2-like [Rhagoletis pomonella]
MILEREYRKGKYLTAERRVKIARSIGVRENQVKYWFQNRRSKGRKSGELFSYEKANMNNTPNSAEKEGTIQRIVQFLESNGEGELVAQTNICDIKLSPSTQPIIGFPLLQWPEQSSSSEELDDIFEVMQEHFGPIC